MLIPEALAHTVRGMVIFFFIFWTVLVFPKRKMSRVMELCYILSVVMTCCYVKDMVFIFDLHPYTAFVDSLVVLVDLSCVPLACAFFIEITNPQGGVRTARIVQIELVQFGFVAAYLLHPSGYIVRAAYLFDLCLTLVALYAVIVYVLRTRRYIAENYSYTETISVNWVIVVFTIYVLLYFGYYVAFRDVTWVSEMAFNLSCMVLWTFVYVILLRHNVIRICEDGSLSARTEEVEEAEYTTEAEQAAEETVPALSKEEERPSLAAIADRTEESGVEEEEGLPEGKTKRMPVSRRTGWTEEQEMALQDCMEVERMYLNPKLTIMMLAKVIGTNRTYLSVYLHEVQGCTFYDYINTYRISASCRFIEEMAESGTRINMVEVATRSGFNSTASFYRYFAKINKISPGEYYNNVMKKIEGLADSSED